jgi:hypothetical protein
VSNHTSRKRQRPTIRCLSFVVRQGMWGSPIFLRRFFSSKVNSPRQTLAVSDNCLSFPTSVCRFRQEFVVSDKCLSIPTSVCRFRQVLVVSDKTFVGKMRATVLEKPPWMTLEMSFYPNKWLWIPLLLSRKNMKSSHARTIFELYTTTVLNGVFLPVLRSTILLTNTGTSIVFVCLS